MIKSMTGYGRARKTLNKRDITVEVRSVNNRYLDCTVKMPRMYTFAEDAIKQHVQKAISRGKVDVYISVDASAADVAKVTVNQELAAGYAGEAEKTYCTYSQVALRHLGDRLLADGGARFVYHRALEQLARFDRENDARLYETLRLYLENEQNTMETARKLFVHRNTLLHRLRKIEELTRLDLGDSQVRLRLLLSLLLDQRRGVGNVHSDTEKNLDSMNIS